MGRTATGTQGRYRWATATVDTSVAIKTERKLIVGTIFVAKWGAIFEIKSSHKPYLDGLNPCEKSMSEIFSRFSLHAAKFHGQVWLCLGAIWLIVLFCTIASINGQPFSTRQRKLWTLIVCLVPVAGALAYLPFSCRWEDFSQLFLFRSKRNEPTAGKGDSKPRPKRISGGPTS